MRLSVYLESAVCAGSGLGRPGYADRDIVFDRSGLPYLPGKRLKGLLRSAYRELRTCAGYGGLPVEDEVFGSPGSRKPKPVRVNNADLEGSRELRLWLDGHLRNGNTLHREDVIDFFTEIRRQTAIDRTTQAPEANTLRSTRVLRPGLTFFSEISGVEQEHVAHLRTAARALQFMGSSRSRGLGEVRCEIAETEGDIQHRQATASGTPDDGRLTFSLKLEHGAIFPGLAGDPNTILTHRCAPGSVIWGMLANRYLKNNGPTERFYHLFCSGAVQFPAANPEIAVEGVRRRSIPTPHSIRRSKAADIIYNLTGNDPDEPIRRVGDWTAPEIVFSDSSAFVRAGTELHYHHARAADPRVGKAVGVEQAAHYGLQPSEAGALFTYESLSPGRVLRGEITGSDADLEEIGKLVQNGETVYLGRSRTSQYGGKALWTWEQPEQAVVPDLRGDIITVTMTAPLLALNDDGHPAPEFPAAELEDALACKLEPYRPEGAPRSFARVHWQGGFFSHQALPRQQMPAISAGSVFMFKASPPPTLDQLLTAQKRGYGLRTEEGFGRVLIGAPVARQVTLTESRIQPNVIAPSPMAVKISNYTYKLRARNAIRSAAIEEAGKANIDNLSSSLMHRLMALVSRNEAASIASLRESALKRLEKIRVGARNLKEFLTEPYNPPDVERWPDPAAWRQTGASTQLPSDYDQYFKICFLRALAWRKQQEAREAVKATGGGL